MSTPQTVAVKAKPFWRTKTFAANVLLALPPALDAFAVAGLEFTSSQWYIGLVIVMNLILRVVTKQPVHMGTTDQAKLVEAAPLGAVIK